MKSTIFHQCVQLSAIVLSCLLARPADAGLIPIANAGFESPDTPGIGTPPDD